ncbi:response regulator transcription factor [Microbacterium hibisci]|uniref:response regulator transcription factor n=1 Tax=Microbacterium hibisci TaxID=2036000 RepID=UPI001941E78E|nr:response regulator transcription factor [Microbacterium hibisci]
MRVVIAEDSGLFREGLAGLLSDAGHEVVGQTGDADEAVRLAVEEAPDVAVLDIRMPPDRTDDGARAALRIRSERPELGIVLLSQHLEYRHALQLIPSGHFGYLLKDRVLAFDDFLDALERVRSGGTALDPEVVTRLLGARAAEGRLAPLTPREREVLGLMAEGLTNAGIAARLWLTERTVESHVTSVFTKLGIVSSETENRRVRAVVAFLEATRPA